MKLKHGIEKKNPKNETAPQKPISTGDSWFTDLQKLSVDELVRIYNTIKSGDYEFAKDAWYNPLEVDKRCPIMVAKGLRTPDTPEKMINFQDTAKILEDEFRSFIDAWDFGIISIYDIEKAVLYLLERASIEITEYTA